MLNSQCIKASPNNQCMVVVDGHSLKNIDMDVCKFSLFSQFTSYSALLVHPPFSAAGFIPRVQRLHIPMVFRLSLTMSRASLSGK